MARTFAVLVFGVTAAFAAPALAQPVDLPIPAATSTSLPEGVAITRLPSGQVYSRASGAVLYGLDMRIVLRSGPDPAQFCTKQCAKDWEPLRAPKDAKVNIQFPQGFGGQQRSVPPGFVRPEAAPDWSVIESAAGKQWVYKGWHLVFSRKGSKAGDVAFDGAEKFTWNTLKYVAPVPQIVAPAGVGTVLLGDAYAFATKEGNVLFTHSCSSECATAIPFTGGMASRAIGKWSISQGGDAPQWLLEGMPVFVAQGPLPSGATPLRP